MYYSMSSTRIHLITNYENLFIYQILLNLLKQVDCSYNLQKNGQILFKILKLLRFCQIFHENFKKNY